ncbi:MAG: ABC-F family ATP-binding cassette domain-containing protein, partial [Tissierellia bacterium]|nr:ABC-F family ATP-binding cassette domain-containing protein [Tissierellia bacterium]
ILRGLGFEEEDFSRKMRSLSGGEERRLYLARLLATDVDVLLLDEPTNHLDMQAISWLELYLSTLASAVVLVTHDREFLDRTVERIYEIEGGKGRWYPGNYSAYTEKKREIYLQEKRSYDNFLKKKKAEEEKLRTFRDRSSLNQKFAARARDREKKILHMQEVEAPLWISRNMGLRFKAARTTGQDIVFCENLSKSFDGEPLFDHLSFSLYKGDVLGIIGPNGSGKTTLMRMLAGKSSPDQGRILFGPGVDKGFYRQHQEELRTSDDMVSFINNQFPQYNHGQIRSLLAQFLFTGDEVFKSIELLSGGEKARLRLLLLMLEERNLLLLDEPTNHLDIYSKETLEEALLHYEGTVVLVSHDRYFLNRVCSRLLVLDGENSTIFEGTYRDYEAKAPDKTLTKSKAKKTSLQSKTKNTVKLKEDPIEDQLLLLEEELQEIELAFLDKELYNDSDKIKQISIKRDDCLQKIDKLYALWGEEE